MSTNLALSGCERVLKVRSKLIERYDFLELKMNQALVLAHTYIFKKFVSRSVIRSLPINLPSYTYKDHQRLNGKLSQHVNDNC